MIVDALVSQPHYAAHLEPIMAKFPNGIIWRRGKGRVLDQPILRRTSELLRADVVMVASGADAQYLEHVGVKRLVYVEHGAGQSYMGDDRARAFGSYAGGSGLDHVDLFVCPNPVVADQWRAAYPGTPAVVVGSPLLDRYHRELHGPFRRGKAGLGMAWRGRLGQGMGVPVLGFTWHWDCGLCAETRSAWSYYSVALPGIVADLRDRGFEVIGHSHPKAAQQRGPDKQWKALRVERVSHEELLLRSDVLVADNTSVQFEAASLGIPNVVLNCPTYRRDVEHGLRFWSHVPGLEVDEPEQVVGRILETLAMDEHPLMVAAAERAYAFRDGRAAERAAAAIASLV